MSSSKVVLITGASTGFGFMTAKTLARKGHHVFATMRGLEGKNAKPATELRRWAESEKLKLNVLELDVTNESSITSAVGTVVSKAGRLDVVVNNAGLGAVGPTEAFTSELFQKQFDVNVFGVHNVNRAALPVMRRQRDGLFINVSSVIGRVSMPFLSVYSASKFALEGLVEGMRHELGAFGIDSVILEPGAFPTTAFGENTMMSDDGPRLGDYGPLAEVPGKMFAGMAEMFGDDMPDPQMVADAIMTLVETPREKRPLRTVVDPTGGEGAKAINNLTDEVGNKFAEAMGLNGLITDAAKQLGD